MNMALLKPILWGIASLAIVGSTVGGVATALNSHGRSADNAPAVALYGSNTK